VRRGVSEKIAGGVKKRLIGAEGRLISPPPLDGGRENGSGGRKTRRKSLIFTNHASRFAGSRRWDLRSEGASLPGLEPSTHRGSTGFSADFDAVKISGNVVDTEI